MRTEKYQVNVERRPMPPIAIAVVALLVISSVALIIVQGLKAPDSSTQAGSMDFVQASEELVPGQDMVVSVDAFTVVVPKDATALSGAISITQREPDIFPAAGAADWTRPQVINVEYRNGLGTPQPNVTFTKPVQVCFKLAPDMWVDYTQRPNEYQVQYYAEEQDPPHWLTLPSLAYPENTHLCGQVSHLSIFALAVKVKAIVPVTGPTPTPAGLYEP